MPPNRGNYERRPHTPRAGTHRSRRRDNGRGLLRPHFLFFTLKGQAMNLINDPTPEQAGERIAYFFKWDIDAITAAFLAALTESNAHTLRAKLEPIITND